MLLKFLENLPLGGADTDLAATQEFIRRRQRTGLAVVVSDLFAPGGFEKGLDRLRHRRYEPHVIQLHDPREARPDFLGDVELVDVENNSSRKVTVTEKTCPRIDGCSTSINNRSKRYCRTYAMGCTQADTRVKFDDLVLRMMPRGGGRRIVFSPRWPWPGPPWPCRSWCFTS